MRLYYYTQKKYAFDAIRDKRIKVARIHELNDSFDFGAAILRSPEDKPYYLRSLAKYGKEIGIICMSECCHEPLMWSHYAGKHTGICLGYDVPSDFFLKVDYIDKRPLASAVLHKLHPEFGFTRDLYQTFTMKSLQWKYEREWRAFAPLMFAVEDGGHHFWKTDENGWILREVLLGERCDAPLSEVEMLLNGCKSSARAYRTQTDDTNFVVVEQKVELP